MADQTIYIIGISEQNIASEKSQIIDKCKTIFCNDHHLETINKTTNLNLSEKKILPIVPLKNVFVEINEKLKIGNVAILASGDPLFYGIGKKIIEKFNDCRVRVIPSTSFMQPAFARFSLNWEDAKFLSLHGRDIEINKKVLFSKDKICVFTDEVNSPQKIAKIVLEQSSHKHLNYKMFVAARLVRKDEYLFQGSLQDIIQHNTFLTPNIVILIRENKKYNINTPVFGLEEKDFSHSRGLITKSEVRAVSLHKLKLPQEGVLWDIGGGSGSVSVEAAKISPELQVYCVEKRKEEQKKIQRNIQKHGVFSINLVPGEAPEVLKELPIPDRVFVGGSGGMLKQIIDFSCSALNKEGIIVINCVLEKTAQLVPEILKRNGFHINISQIAVTRYDFFQETTNSLNPITIVTGEKK